MPKEFKRSSRVADLLQHELAEIVRRELSIPRMGMLTVSAVDVSPDLRNAKIYVTTLGGDLDQRQVVEALTHQAGFFRHHLAQRVKLRAIPRLSFAYDTSVEYGQRLSSLIDQALATEAKPE
jgi:ribosome-binding factor A